jgi:hypothetical protein
MQLHMEETTPFTYPLPKVWGHEETVCTVMSLLAVPLCSCNNFIKWLSCLNTHFRQWKEGSVGGDISSCTRPHKRTNTTEWCPHVLTTVSAELRLCHSQVRSPAWTHSRANIALCCSSHYWFKGFYSCLLLILFTITLTLTLVVTCMTNLRKMGRQLSYGVYWKDVTGLLVI